MKATRRGPALVTHEARTPRLPKDSYRPKGKPAGPAVCPDCGAAWLRGRWTWTKPAGSPRRLRCPACRRIAQGMPAGFVTLEGPFLAGHREEIVRRLKSCEAQEKREHPLQRIMEMRGEGRRLVVTTTDVHLARRLGEALVESFKGVLEARYARGRTQLRASWSR